MSYIIYYKSYICEFSHIYIYSRMNIKSKFYFAILIYYEHKCILQFAILFSKLFTLYELYIQDKCY